jgi:hypothetical protein
MKKTRETFFCVQRQTQNVRNFGFYDLRKSLVLEAHRASQDGDKAAFDEAAKNLGIITRSVGNPLSPGRKEQELSPYFHCLSDLEEQRAAALKQQQTIKSHL